MFRFAALAAVVLAALLPVPAFAQPALPGSFRVVEAKADKDKLTWSETTYLAQQKLEERAVVVNGMNVKQQVTVTVMVPVQQTVAFELKKLKAINGAGKAIDADKLAEALKDATPVVIVSGPVPEKYRALFREKTIFLELPLPEPGKLVPPPPVAPPGAAPVGAPGEKKG